MRGQAYEGLLHRFERPDLFLDISDLGLGLAKNADAGSARSETERQELLDLLQRETKRLGMLDETEAAHVMFSE